MNELRVAGITTVAAANRYLRDHFLGAFNAEFGRPPADPTSAFEAVGAVDLDQILCVEDERVVSRDNVVTLDRLALQLGKQPGRRTCAGLRVLIRRHLNGQHTVWYGSRCLGRYDPQWPPPGGLTRCLSPSGQITVSNSCGQITYQQQRGALVEPASPSDATSLGECPAEGSLGLGATSPHPSAHPGWCGSGGTNGGRGVARGGLGRPYRRIVRAGMVWRGRRRPQN